MTGHDVAGQMDEMMDGSKDGWMTGHDIAGWME